MERYSRLQGWCVWHDGHQATLALEHIQDVSLLRQDEPIGLLSDSGQSLPSLEILGVPLIPVCILGVLPVSFREAQHSVDFSARNVVDQGNNGARLLQPVDLPQLSWPYALICGGLIVGAAGHGATVDGVDDTVFRKEPDLVTPFFWVAFSVCSGVVVNEVCVADIILKGWVQGGICLVSWEGHYKYDDLLCIDEKTFV